MPVSATSNLITAICTMTNPRTTVSPRPPAPHRHRACVQSGEERGAGEPVVCVGIVPHRIEARSEGDASLLGELERVGHQIDQHLPKVLLVADHPGRDPGTHNVPERVPHTVVGRRRGGGRKRVDTGSVTRTQLLDKDGTASR